MPNFLVHQSHLIVGAKDALEAQVRLTAETIVETRIERLSEDQNESLSRMSKAESPSVSG